MRPHLPKHAPLLHSATIASGYISVAFNRDELVPVRIRACFYMGLSAAGAGDGGIGAAAADDLEIFTRQFHCEAILLFDEFHFFLHFQ
jgi:hypothetical protein